MEFSSQSLYVLILYYVLCVELLHKYMHVYICVCTYLFTLRYYTQRCNMLLDTMNKMNNILELLYSFLSEVSLKNQSSLSLSFFTSILPPFHPFLLLFFFLVLFILCSELSARSYFDIGTENLLQLSHPFNSDQYGQSPKSYWTMTIMKLSKVFHLIKVIINMNRLSCFHSILFVSIVI